MSEFYIGLMSGTSLDGVDGVLAKFDTSLEPPGRLTTQICAHVFEPFAEDLHAELLALNQSGQNELHRAALAANGLALIYARLTEQLLRQAGLAATAVRAIGAHGQTVRHQPGEFDGIGYTWQLNAPALLAERTGIAVVADLRARDIAAGGQGAPLVPAFHQAVFGRADGGSAALNIGGMSNLTVMPAQTLEPFIPAQTWGFDCGPGNVLMDLWIQQQLGQDYDREGHWAASGAVRLELLQSLLAEPFLYLVPPKSTGRDLFNEAWLKAALQRCALGLMAPVDVQATLCQFTVEVCAQAVRAYAGTIEELIVCGGGAYNTHLMRGLQTALPDIAVLSSSQRGLLPNQVESAAFAWLARAHLHQQAGNLPRATGASGTRILGALYPV